MAAVDNAGQVSVAGDGVLVAMQTRKMKGIAACEGRRCGC